MSATAPASLEDRIHARSVRLHALAAAVHETFGAGARTMLSPNSLRDALRDLRACLDAVPAAHAVIVGGLALQELGHERWTRDIDLLADAAHFREVLDALRAGGFELSTERSLRHRATGVEVDLLKEGVTLRGGRLPLPHPRELGPNRGTATLSGLLRLKLDSPRLQDQADIVALIKKRGVEVLAARAALPAELHALLDALFAQAEREA